MSDFNAAQKPMARKVHRCEECGRAIQPGERYERVAAVWEGSFFTNVACAHCAAAREIVRDHDRDYSEYYYGGLSEWLNEMGNEAIWSLRLLAGLKAQWRLQSGALMPAPARQAVSS